MSGADQEPGLVAVVLRASACWERGRGGLVSLTLELGKDSMRSWSPNRPRPLLPTFRTRGSLAVGSSGWDALGCRDVVLDSGGQAASKILSGGGDKLVEGADFSGSAPFSSSHPFMSSCQLGRAVQFYWY